MARYKAPALHLGRRATDSADMNAGMRAQLRTLRNEVSPTQRETLAGAIKRHGGNASVVQQMGLTKGSKEYKAAMRNLQRYTTEGKEQRGATKLKPAMEEALQKVLGKATVERIKSGAKSKTLPQLPPGGRLSVTFAGTIKVVSGRKGQPDIRDRVVTVDIPAGKLDAFMRDPVGTWVDSSGFDAELVDMRAVQMSYSTKG